MSITARQGRRIKMRNANKIKVMGWVALTTQRARVQRAAPAQKGAPRRSARRDGSQREPSHLFDASALHGAPFYCGETCLAR